MRQLDATKLGSQVAICGIQNTTVSEVSEETAWRHYQDSIMAVPDKLPIDTAHRLMLRNALPDTLSDAQKMLSTMMAGGSQSPKTPI